MNPGGLFSVNDFAKMARIPKDTLLYYDKIGLLTPDMRGDNKYRYYSILLLATVNMIRTLQKLGMSLEEIKELKDNRSPHLAEDVLSRQINKIDIKIEEWVRSRKLLITLMKTINDALDVDENTITIKFLPAEAIVLGDINDYSRGRDAYDALLSFYHSIGEKYPDVDLNYPVWAMFKRDRIIQGDWIWPDRYYFFNPEGHDKRPAALYAIGYTRGGYGQSDEVYKRVIEYIDNNGFEICGDAYEEYPLNEICIVENNNYLLRVMIAVREKHADNPPLESNN